MGKAVQLTWPNHAIALTAGVAKLFKEDFKTDFELSINGCYVKAHQLILAIFCSKVHKRKEQSTLILGEQPFLDRQDLELLLNFIYTGKVNVEEDKLFSLKELCDLVGFKALSDIIKTFLVRKKLHAKQTVAVKKIIPKPTAVSAPIAESKDDFMSNEDGTSDLSKLLESVASNLENNESSKVSVMESSESTEYDCKYCLTAFDSSRKLRLHLLSHKRSKRKYECEHCLYKTVNRTCFASHMINKHQMDVKGNPQPRNIQCPQCSYMCSAQFQLKNHVYNVHSVKRQVCEICGYRCPGNAIMEKHKKMAHSTAKPLMCETCGMRFKIIWDLKKHLVIHQGGAKVTCEVCGINVSAKHYSHHKKIHSNKPKPHGCHLCSFSSWKNWNLKFHLKTVHKLIVESGNSKILAQQDQNI